MQRTIENGNRYQAVKDTLAEKADSVVVVSETTTDRFDEKKGKLYHEVAFAVAPINAQEAFDASDLFGDMKPIFPDGSSARTFDTLGEREFRPIRIHVFPSVEAAKAVRE